MRESHRLSHLRRWRGIALFVSIALAGLAASPIMTPAHPMPRRADRGDAARAEFVDGVARAVSVAAADCDRDGRADVIAGYETPTGGLVAIYPVTSRGLAAEPRLAALPVAPELLAAGDLSADGITTIVAAARHATELWTIRVNFDGSFGTPERIDQPGPISALATGEFGRHDGRSHVAVGIAGAEGASAVLMSSADGSPLSEVCSVPLAQPPAAFCFGQFDASAPFDLAIAAGDTVVLVHGDRVTSPGFRPEVEAREVGHALASIDAMPVAGSFGSGVAMLATDGTLSMLRPSGTERAPGGIASWGEESIRPNAMPGASRVIAAPVSGDAVSDLLILDDTDRSLTFVSGAAPTAAKPVESESPMFATPVVAAIALRLNGDALSDVVAFGPDRVGPIVKTSGPRATFTVTNTNDSGAGSLRDAITQANSTGGADVISFAIPGSNFTISLTSALPSITEAVTIDGSTQTGYSGTPLVELDGSGIGPVTDGLAVTGGGNCTIRALVINRFNGNGIRLDSVDNNVVEGCYIGTDDAGAVDLGNDGAGISIIDSANNTIGGPGDSANVISGNGLNGIQINTGIAIGNTVTGNRIGTNAAGSTALPNSGAGVLIGPGGANNTIGGVSETEGNVISGNGTNGVGIAGADATANLVENNIIGLKADGSAGLPNNVNGVAVAAFDNTIHANRIGFNIESGIVCGLAGTGNTFTANSINSNGALGIDLLPDGITPNDGGDNDGGPNRTQNFPVLTSATVEDATTTVTGTLASQPSTLYRIEFFASPSCDPSGYGEGATYLGFVNVSTSASGNATINFSANIAVAASAAITATATDPGGNTSEFSACVSAAANADVSVTQQSAPDPVPTGSLLTYTITIANAGPLPAADLQLLGSTPSGTTFQSVSAATGTFEAPPIGGAGAVTGNFGTLAVGGTIVVTFRVLVVGPGGQVITNTVFAGSSTPDPNTDNNTSTEQTTSVVPPIITSITKLVVAGKPFKVKISGANFQPGVVVFIGADITPWVDVKYKNDTMLVLRKGGALKAKFPKGVPVSIEVRNPDGGSATGTFTR